MTRFQFVRLSRNRKTGPIPVTMTTRDSCPASCAFYNRGCYAETGAVRWNWNRLQADQGETFDLDGLTAQLRALPRGSLWRHNIAGDLPGDGETIDRGALLALAKANKGRRGFTYTHKPIQCAENHVIAAANLTAIRAATDAGFTINLSADNPAQADTLARTGLPVVVVIPSNSAKVSHTPAGRKIVQCPAENSARITCANCGLCQLARRPYLIGFKPKGVRQKLVNSIASTGETRNAITA